MGQLKAIDRLPEVLRDKVIEMIKKPGLYQSEIVDAINAEAGKKVISRASLNRYVLGLEKLSGTKRGRKPPSAEESLVRVAKALERIAFSLENQYKKTS